MHRSPVPPVSGNDLLTHHLTLLSSISAGRTAILSCFFDTSAGEAAIRQFLAERRQQLKRALPSSEQTGLDETFAMAEAAFSHHRQENQAGMAIFARSGDQDRFLHVLPLEAGVDAGVHWYRLPQLLPLHAVRQGAGKYRMLLARSSGLQVLDIDGETATLRAWSGMLTKTGAAATNRFDGQTLLLRRVLSDVGNLPLVIAGDSEALPVVTGWLPKRTLAHVIDQIPVPAYLDMNDAIAFVRTDRDDRRRLESELEVSRLIRSLRGHGSAVTGPRATLEALRAGQVDTLLLGYTEGRLRGMPAGYLCGACEEPGAADFDAGVCVECGGEKLSGVDFLAEVAWLVARDHVNLIFSDSEELQYVGGIGCLLKHPAESQVMPQPVRHRRLDLVA